MKQVWIVNHYAQEPGGVGGTRHFSLGKELLAYGWATTIIAASVELNTGRQRLTKNEVSRLNKFDGVPFLWVRTPEYQGNKGGRLKNMLSYTVRVLVPSVTRGLQFPNVVVGSSVHPFAAWSGAVLAKRFGVPFIFEVRDLWPQTLIDLGRIKNHSIAAFGLRKLERWLYQKADRIIVLLPQANEYIERTGIRKEKISYVPNGVDLTSFPLTSVSKSNNVFTLMYFGAHGQANDLENLMLAFHLLQHKTLPQPIKLRMIGDGPIKIELEKIAEKYRLDNVSFEPPVPKARIPVLASEADGFVICVKDLPGLYRYGISMNKLFDYLASARPIVISSNASNNPVQEAGAGITVAPNNPIELADGIIKLLKLTPEQRFKMGMAGRAYVEAKHGYDRLGKRFASLLDELLLSSRINS